MALNVISFCNLLNLNHFRKIRTNVENWEYRHFQQIVNSRRDEYEYALYIL